MVQQTSIDEHTARQNYSRHAEFTVTQADNNAADALNLSNLGLNRINKISLVVELYDAYVKVDGTATVGATSMLIPAGEGYFDDGVNIQTNISFINASAGNNARIRGIAWGYD